MQATGDRASISGLEYFWLSVLVVVDSIGGGGIIVDGSWSVVQLVGHVTQESAMGAKMGWVAAGFLSLLAGLCLRGTQVLEYRSAGITVSQPVISIKASQGTDVIMVFVPLVNNSSTRDRLVGMKSSCHCVTTADLPHEILPRESWNLPLKINASEYTAGDSYLFELTLFLESGSAVPVQINFAMTDQQSSDSSRI